MDNAGDDEVELQVVPKDHATKKMLREALRGNFLFASQCRRGEGWLSEGGGGANPFSAERAKGGEGEGSDELILALPDALSAVPSAPSPTHLTRIPDLCPAWLRVASLQACTRRTSSP